MLIWSNYKYFYDEFVKKNIKEFLILLSYVILEGIIITLSVFSIIPIADFFLDPSLLNANFVTVYYVKILNFAGIEPSLFIFFAFFVLTNFLKSISSTLISYGIMKIRFKVIRRFSYNLLEKLLSVKWEFYLKNSSGKILNTYTQEIKKISGGLRDFCIQIASLLKLATYLIMPMFLNLKITLITIGLASLFAVPFLMLGKIAHELGKKDVEKSNKLYFGINEALQAAKLIITFVRKKIVMEENKKRYEELYNTQMKNQIFDIILTNLYPPFSILAVGLAIVLSVESAENMSTLAAILWSLLAALPNLSALVRGNAVIQNLIPSFKQFKEIEIGASTNIEKFGKIEFKGIKNQIEFKNVEFKHKENEKILENLNLKIKKNEVTALVGISGSGKSTIVDLLIGLHLVDKGKICLDENDIKDINIKSFREKISIISQETFLFNTTIYENLKWADPNASDQDIKEALELSNSNEFINKFEKGIYTQVGERGNNLSGGQKQRISIARGLLKKPSLLILDEPTSSLDSASEVLIKETLEKIAEKTTTLIIAHRISTILNANYVYLLSKGKIIQEGTLNDIKKEEGNFKKLFQNQIY